jgi:starvation-inducible outer membrane lipoprotein
MRTSKFLIFAMSIATTALLATVAFYLRADTPAPTSIESTAPVSNVTLEPVEVVATK